MTRACSLLVPAVLFSGAAFCQSAENTPKFEVADVQVSPHTSQPVVRGPFFSSGRYELRFASMLDLVRIAYNVDPERVYGGPSWLEIDRFDVVAKTPAGSNAESRRSMLQALLTERFHLAAHKDSKPTPAFALTAGKHPLLKEAEGTGESGCNFSVQNNGPQPPSDGSGAQVVNLPVLIYACRNVSLAAFASGMLEMPGAAQYFDNRPVVDQSDLKGAWDFTLRYTPKVPAGIKVTGESIPLFDAVEKQLGLKLEASTVPMPVIMVDSVNQKPTPNPPEVAKVFPPLPTEFEVAEIKPSESASGRGGDLRPEVKNGRLYVPGINLASLIIVSWDLNGPEMLADAPKWMNEDRFDVIAKAPAGVSLGELNPQRSGIPINIDALRPMLRALIIDRFKLATHTEDRPLSTYTLTAVKPKLQKADPKSRTRWQNSVAPESKSKNANLGRRVECQNVTMAQFAEMIPQIAPGYVRTKVVDATGLEGGWDFTFSFSPAGALQGGGAGRGGAGAGGGPPGESAPEASEPSGGLSLFDALTKELGLKLEMQKRPQPVLVIDHVERKPIDN